jgi:hypothetical protein
MNVWCGVCCCLLSQGQLACRRLEQRLVEELELKPNSPAGAFLQEMLERTRRNLGESRGVSGGHHHGMWGGGGLGARTPWRQSCACVCTVSVC